MRHLAKIVGLATAAAVALAGCGQATAATPAQSSKPSPTGSQAAGLPAFYQVPNPLEPGRPGEVVKTAKVDAPQLHGDVYRVMYHSRSVPDRDIVVTGMIAVPHRHTPPGGFPVITWGHGTDGIAAACAPSLRPDVFGDLGIAPTNALLDQGYLVTASDYEGLGTTGHHPYLVGGSEARSMLDIVRAARQLHYLHASDSYIVWGHSEGGHAAMFSLHDAQVWVPELRLRGVVAGAPPSQLTALFALIENTPFKYHLLMVTSGFNSAYGNATAPLDQIMTTAGMSALDTINNTCQYQQSIADTDFSTLFKADPANNPAWIRLLGQNDPGRFTVPVKAPLLIIQGGNDAEVPVASTQVLFGQLCRIGQIEQRWIYPGQSHGGVISASMNDMTHWIADRFAGKPASASAAPAGVNAMSCPN